jgi:lipoprotein-releasing system ATP-binding protein
VITIEELGFAYGRGATPVFHGLSHTFLPGTVTALSGESGKGKSTLLYLLGLLLRPSSGRLGIHRTEVGNLGDSQRSRMRNSEIGFVFQDASLDPARTILDSVLEPALYSGRRRSGSIGRARALLDEFGVGVRANHRPGEISGGQSQRVAICRALMNEPSIILADEPTGNLDGKNASLVLDLLVEQARNHGKTIIVATHDPRVLARVDVVFEI